MTLWRGAYPGLPCSSHTSWCQTHFISSRLGTWGLPLQDYFLLRFVFQLETLGAPRQGVAPSLWPRRLQRARSGMPAGRRGTLPAQGMGAPDGVPHSFSSCLLLLMWLKGCIYGQKVTSKVRNGDSQLPPPPGLKGGQEMHPP